LNDKELDWTYSLRTNGLRPSLKHFNESLITTRFKDNTIIGSSIVEQQNINFTATKICN